MKRAISTAVLFLVAVLTHAPKALADNPHFTTIDFPGAGLTVANGVNQNGEVVGFYRLVLPSGGLGPFRGFLLSNGLFKTIQVPRAARTRAYGINDAGDVVGDYLMSGVNYGFLLKAGSTAFQTIQYTANNTFAATFTDSWGVDDDGNVTGGFNDAAGETWAYVWRDGSFTKLMKVPDSVVTYTHGTNANGEIVGCTFLPDPTNPGATLMHSLRVAADGSFLIEDFPGSMMSMHWRITDSSIIVGHYVDMENVNHGYLYKNGEYETIDFPGSTFTQTRGIAEIEEFNRNGKPLGTRQLLIVGPYDDNSGARHGFLFTRRIGVGLNELP